VADLKPVYLVCGDDDPKIDDWRARVRRRAEEEAGPGALEHFEAGEADPSQVAAAVATLSFNSGTRYLLAEGVEAWKPADLAPIEREIAQMPPDTVLVLVARGKKPDRLAKAVAKAGGEARQYAAPKPRELPKWTVERAREQGLRLDAAAAKALVAAVGPRQARIAREIERLALLVHPRTQLGAEEIEKLAAGEASSRAYDLADALVAGDGRAALRLAEELVHREGRPSGLLFPVVRRLREVQRAAELLDAGMPEQTVASALKSPPWLAKRTVAQARRASREGLERALCAFADLELDLRGQSELDEHTALSLALVRAAA
jgi:DNA polymerase III subunit delta